VTTTLKRREVSFEFPDDVPLVWTPYTPDLAIVANSISLMMPFVEPYFAKSVRAASRECDEDLRDDAEQFARQELSHHAAHHEFNRALVERCPRLAGPERVMRRTYAWLWKRWGHRFGTAYAAAGESFAYSAARWVERRLDLFRGADPEVSSMFVWHLAEEVEHKTVAFDVYETTDGSRWRLFRAMVLVLTLVALFGLWSTFVQLWATRRIFNPVASWHVFSWTLSFAFELLPLMAVGVTRGHHPDDLVDPGWYGMWLSGHDASGDSKPRWKPPGMV
jgi:predicted metal-dependent hydrolase